MTLSEGASESYRSASRRARSRHCSYAPGLKPAEHPHRSPKKPAPLIVVSREQAYSHTGKVYAMAVFPTTRKNP